MRSARLSSLRTLCRPDDASRGARDGVGRDVYARRHHHRACARVYRVRFGLGVREMRAQESKGL